MKILSLVTAVLVLALAALILVDGLLGSLGSDLFSVPVFKIIVGFVLVVISAGLIDQIKESQ